MKWSLFLFLLVSVVAEAGSISSLHRAQKKSEKRRDYQIGRSRSYSFKACEKYDSDKESSYYIRCNIQNKLTQEDSINELYHDLNAVKVDLLEDHFIRGLKKNLIEQLQTQRDELSILESCIEQRESNPDPKCRKVLSIQISNVRTELPKQRQSLLWIHENTENLSRFGTKEKLKAFSKDEISQFQKEKESFKKESLKDLHIKENEKGIHSCLLGKQKKTRKCRRFSQRERSEIKNKLALKREEHKKDSDRFATKNRLYAVSNLTGVESDKEIFDELSIKTKQLKNEYDSYIKSFSKFEGKALRSLIDYDNAVESYLVSEGDGQLSCDIAERLKTKYESEESIQDFKILAHGLLLTGVCLVACTTAVGGAAVLALIGIETGALDLVKSIDRREYFEHVKKFDFVGQEKIDEIDSEIRNGIVLNVALGVGGGALKVAGKGGKAALKGLKSDKKVVPPRANKRIDRPQRTLISDIEKDIGDERLNFLLAKYRINGLKDIDKKDKVYLAGIADIIEKKPPKGISPSTLKKEIDKIILSCGKRTRR